MKICLINNFPPYSGAGRVTYAMWKYLKRRSDLEVDFYCTHAMKKDELLLPENSGVKFIHNFTYDQNENLSRFLIYFIDRFRIPKGYDIYHIGNQMIGFLIGNNKPNVVTLFDVLQFKYDDKLGNNIISYLYNFLIRKSVANLKNADAILSISNYSKKEAINLLKIDPNKIHVIYCGVDKNVFKKYDRIKARNKLKLPLNKKIVLHVGSEIPRKNVAKLIDAFGLYLEKYKKENNTVMVRLGSGSKNIKDKISERKLEKMVIYRESILQNETALYYSAADVLILPSIEEGFGLPIVEAMACECPVITSNCGAMKEVAGTAAILVNPNRIQDIAKKIHKALSLNSKEKQILIDRGNNRVKIFSWEKYTDKVVSIYYSLLNAI